MAWDGHRDLHLSMHLLTGVKEWQRWAHPSIFQQFLGGTNEDVSRLRVTWYRAPLQDRS